ncbi:hypothetical protein JQX13_23045 [Archangium violaceum]|uniref:hypothetical protein n=1 Tax=Archangium violaceum TaxID=83451 RepID=UPI00193AFE23|nr:hypothetical protein [Archangium violaceum]QRK12654.1 hypothetical protein JQX13_23045 [Archangium violaceum]
MLRAALRTNTESNARVSSRLSDKERAWGSRRKVWKASCCPSLALARRVVRTGGHGAGGELVRAREAGLSDAEVVDVIAAVTLRSFTNAVAVVAQTELDWPKAPALPGT